MSRNLSVFLDLLRLFAALLVVVGHAGAAYRLHLPDIVGHSAKEGVAIFFVLSGLVIAFVVAEKERDWLVFARARILRMYSVIPLALVVLICCRGIGTYMNPGFYAFGYRNDATLGGALTGEAPALLPVLRYLTFTNELWFDRAVVSTGAPFWSLAFEVAYYVAFAIIAYVPGPRRWVLLALWLIVCGPRIAVAFPLWLIGVVAWRIVQLRPRMKPALGVGILIGLALCTAAWRKWAGASASPLFEWPAPAPLVVSMAYYLQLGVLLLAIIVVFEACTPARSIWPGWLERSIRYGAGCSFTLYIVHLPILVLVAAIRPAYLGTLSGGALAIFISVCAALMLAELGERRKKWFAKIQMRSIIKLKSKI